jgi:multidrug efflux pump subunit AcrA (membrane-fusion protein)
VKLGINDGVSTEVLEGLKPGDLVVTGVTTDQSSASVPRGTSNPLSGGGGRRF